MCFITYVRGFPAGAAAGLVLVLGYPKVECQQFERADPLQTHPSIVYITIDIMIIVYGSRGIEGTGVTSGNPQRWVKT